MIVYLNQILVRYVFVFLFITTIRVHHLLKTLCIFPSFIPFSSINFLEAALVKALSDSPALYFFSSSFLSSHTLSIMAACQGSFKRSLAVELVWVSLQSVVTRNEDMEGEVLEKLRWERMRGEKSERVRGLLRWSAGHPAVVLCLVGESAFFTPV